MLRINSGGDVEFKHTNSKHSFEPKHFMAHTQAHMICNRVTNAIISSRSNFGNSCGITHQPQLMNLIHHRQFPRSSPSPSFLPRVNSNSKQSNALKDWTAFSLNFLIFPSYNTSPITSQFNHNYTYKS